MSQTTAALGPRDVFEHVTGRWLAGDLAPDADLLAEDVIIEWPFALPGQPRRIEGRTTFMAFAEPARAAFPARFDEIRIIAIHDTADPEVIVVEYELAGTITATGTRAAASFISVLRIREGKVAHWREYQNSAAITAALSGAPQAEPSRP